MEVGTISNAYAVALICIKSFFCKSIFPLLGSKQNFFYSKRPKHVCLRLFECGNNAPQPVLKQKINRDHVLVPIILNNAYIFVYMYVLHVCTL